MQANQGVLTDAQKQHFLERGYITLSDCFPRKTAEAMTSHAFQRLGYDPNDPATWEKSRIHMPSANRYEMKTFAPKAYAAACELLGGEDRVRQPCNWGDGFIVNFRDHADKPWQPSSALSPGWHKDGDFFLHFLDSPEQGLLTLVLWSDIGAQGGGTFAACDSVPVIARFLAQHPEGVRPNQFDFRELIAQCQEFHEFTGKTGDVVLLHPYILHASSPNLSGKPRFLTNPPVALKEPMNFNRANPDDYSLVERAVLRGLGVERLDFQPTSPRERITPQREIMQKQMLEEEKQRLAQAGVAS